MVINKVLNRVNELSRSTVLYEPHYPKIIPQFYNYGNNKDNEVGKFCSDMRKLWQLPLTGYTGSEWNPSALTPQKQLFSKGHTC